MTSTSAPATPKAPGLSESQFLDKQVEDAKLAMAHTWADLKHSLSRNADVRLWTKQYPWIATGTAVVAGLAAGYALTPRDRDEAQEMWEKFKAKLASAPKETAAQAGAAAQPQPSILGSILREAIKLAGPLVASLVAANVAGEEVSSHNGKDNSDAPADSQ